MIHWGALLIVQLVSFGATIAVVGLISLAIVGLSARGAPAAESGRHATTFSPRSGTAVGAICLVAAAMIVLFGLWEIVA
jgi:hypothetical protein